jgi:hypothetical protein
LGRDLALAKAATPEPTRADDCIINQNIYKMSKATATSDFQDMANPGKKPRCILHQETRLNGLMFLE